ncbi:MAG: hypothetical protein NTX33_06250 [Propionibacteriales bacterium]|nr:hypothetical protein [Propionibacteriales bacterium]
MSEIATGASGAWSYRAGSWFAVFGTRATVLLPESQKDQVVALWALIDGGAGFDEVLDGLLASGLSRIPGFVLVSTDDGPTRVLLRGQGVTASLTGDGEDVMLDGAASHTWVERAVEGVTALTVVVPGETADDGDTMDFPITGGLVRVGRIDRPPVATEVATSEDAGLPGAVVVDEVAEAAEVDEVVDAPVEEPVAEEPVAEEPDDAAPADGGPDLSLGAPLGVPPLLPPPPPLGGAHLAVDDDVATSDDVMVDEPSPFDEGPVTEVMEAVPGDPLTDPLTAEPEHAAPDGWVTPWDNPAPTDVPAADPLAEPDTPAVPSPSFPPLGGATEVAPAGWTPPPPPVDAGVADAPPLPIGSWEPVGGTVPPPPGGPDAFADHDGLTVVGAGEPDVPAHGIPGQPQAPAVTQPVAKLLISDGQNVVVDRAVLIGRAPEARRFTSTEQPTLITVPSRLHEISSTHVEVRPGTGADHGTAVVTDMGSTNGTVLVQPGLGPEDLKPGIAVQLIPGAIINLGDGITIQVTRP